MNHEEGRISRTSYQGQATNSHGSQQGSKASDPPEDTGDDADLDPVVKPNLQPNLITITESENINDEVPAWAEPYTKRYHIPVVLKRSYALEIFRSVDVSQAWLSPTSIVLDQKLTTSSKTSNSGR